MLDFFKKYHEIFLIFPVWFVLGNKVAPLCYLFAFLTFGYWHLRGKPHHLIIAFAFIVMLGDTKIDGLMWIKNVRVSAILFLAIATIEGLYKGRFGIKKIFLITLPFFAVATIALRGSPVMVTGFMKMTSYFLFLFVALHYFTYYIKKDKKVIVMDMVKLISFAIILCFVLALVVPHLAIYSGVALQGFFGNPNGLGVFCSMSFPFVLIVSTIYPHQKKFMILPLMLMALAVLFAQSRTAMASILVFTMLFTLYKNRHVWVIRSFWYFILPLTVFFVLSYGFVNILVDAGLGKYMRVHTIVKGSGRFFAWQEALKEMDKSWWIGRGFEYERSYFRKYNKYFTDNGHEGNMHNSYLVFMMNTGVIGLSLIMYFYFSMFKRIRGEARRFIIPLLVPLTFSATFESWLSASLNNVMIIFFFILLVLTFYNDLKYPHLKYQEV